jgi:hypothetical protein
MSLFLTRVIAIGGTVVLMVAFQHLVSNRRGSEQLVEQSIATLTPASWNFVAMEYCYGMLNRTYLILVTDHAICGARIRGPMSAPMIVSARHYLPYSYLSPRVVQKYAHMNVESAAFLSASRANFQIARHDIESCEFTAKAKWGMGSLHIRAWVVFIYATVPPENSSSLANKMARTSKRNCRDLIRKRVQRSVPPLHLFRANSHNRSLSPEMPAKTAIYSDGSSGRYILHLFRSTPKRLI